MVLYITAILVSLAIFLAGSAYLRYSPGPNPNRKEAVRRSQALIWGVLVGSFVAGIFLLIGLLWYIVGNLYMISTGERGWLPSGRWNERFERYISWPYEQVIFAITGQGQFVLWPQA